MRNVAFMPKNDILHGCLKIGAYYTSQAAYLFTRDRISFVGHGRRSFLSGSKVFFCLSNLRTLQSTYLGGYLFQAASNNRYGCQELGMAVPLDNLSRDRIKPQAKP